LTLTEQLQHNEEPKAWQQVRTIPTTNKTDGEQSVWDSTFQPLVQTCPFNCHNQSIKDEFNPQWLKASVSCHRFANLREVFQGDLSMKVNVGSTCQEVNPYPATAELGRRGHLAATTCAGMEQQDEKSAGKAHTRSTQQKLKQRMSNLARNQTQMLSTLHHSSLSLRQIHPSPPNVKKSHAASSDKAT